MPPLTLRGLGTTYRFVIVGTAAAGLYFLLAWTLLEAGARPAVSGVVSYAIAFAFAYSLQHGWTFAGAAPHGRALPKYALVQLACAGASSGLLAAGTALGGAPLLVSLAATGTVSLASFFASKFWVFRQQ